MSDRLEILMELERRGKLPEKYVPMLAEVRSRGLVPEAKKQGFGRRLWENVVGDDDPTTQNVGERIGSAMNKAGEAMTFGLIGDEASAAVESVLPGVEYDDRRDHYRGQEEVLERDNPGLALGSEIGGALLGAVAAPVSAAGRLANAPGLLRMLGTMGASGAAGAAGGGTYGFMEGEGGLIPRMDDAKKDAGFGLLAGLAAPVVAGAVGKGVDTVRRGSAMRKAAQGAPTTGQLKDAAGQAYDAMDGAGVQLNMGAVDELSGNIQNRLLREGYSGSPGTEALNPKTRGLLARMGETVDGMSAAADSNPGLPYREVEGLRRVAGNVARSTDAADARFGAIAIEEIDNFVNGLRQDQLIEGDPEALKSAIVKARDLYARYSRSKVIDEAVTNSESYLSGQASGIRNQFKTILKSKKLSRGMTDAERSALKRAIDGSAGQKVLHMLGGGLSQLGLTGGGAAVGSALGVGPVGGALLGAAAGQGARKASEGLARREAEIARGILANGGFQGAPQISPASRGLLEDLMRRAGAVANE